MTSTVCLVYVANKLVSLQTSISDRRDFHQMISNYFTIRSIDEEKTDSLTDIYLWISSWNESPDFRWHIELVGHIAEIDIFVLTLDRTDDIGDTDRVVMIDTQSESITIMNIDIFNQLGEKR